MPMYGLGTRPLIDDVATTSTIQVWFADDSSAAGKIENLHQWFTKLKEKGSLYGYFPKASKCKLILKNPSLLEKAKEHFGAEGVDITTEGARHLGAVLGTEQFKHKYVRGKVQKWVADIE